MAVAPKQEKPQEKQEEQVSPEQVRVKLEEERLKMLAEGTKPSEAKTAETVSPQSGDTGKSVPESVRSVPAGVSLVEEPRIASTAGKLVVEPRTVSTGGQKHPETEPSSTTPPSPDLPPVERGPADPSLRGDPAEVPADDPNRVFTTGTSAPSGGGDPNFRPLSDHERHQQKLKNMQNAPSAPAAPAAAPEDRQTAKGDAALQGKKP